MKTARARLHRVIGGYVCRLRRSHHLVLAEDHWLERTGVSHFQEADGRLMTLQEMEHHSVEFRSGLTSGGRK